MKKYNQEPIIKQTKLEIKISRIITTVFSLVSVYFVYQIFNDSLENNDFANIYNQISVGAVLVGLSSTVVSLLSQKSNSIYRRILLNIDILFRDLTTPKVPWRRWPFVKRQQIKKTMNGEIHVSTLGQAEITFDVGVREIDVFIPTCEQDFHDLPVLHTFLKLAINNKSFYSYYAKNIDKMNVDPMIKDKENPWIVWDCLLDVWKYGLLMKLFDIVILILTVIIIFSAILSFAFPYIQSMLINILCFLHLI